MQKPTMMNFLLPVFCIKFVQNIYNLPNWHQNSTITRFDIPFLQQSGIPVDKVTQFSLRRPELRSTIDMIGNFHNWLYTIMDTNLKSDQMKTGIKNELKETLWIDGIQ